MEKIWLNSYPRDVPATVDPTQYRSLVHLLDEAFHKYATRPAYVCMGSVLTYADIDRLSRRLAAWLRERRLQPGARVAIMLPNLLQYPVAVAAVLRAGYTVVNVNPLYTPRELSHQLRDSGAEAIVVLDQFACTLQQVIARSMVRHVIVTGAGDLLGPLKGRAVNAAARHVRKMVPPYALPGAVTLRRALADGAALPFEPVELRHGDIAFLQYTGGTTGVAKGAMLSHRNIIANVLQNEAWAQPALDRAPKIDTLRIVCALPLYHVLALTACMLMGTRWGALNILIPNPRDIDGFVKELRRHRFHMLPAVNTLFNALLNHPRFSHLDFSSLRISLGGGMAVQKTVGERWRAVTGCPVIEGYGLSETSPVATLNPTDAVEFSGSIGLPIPSTEVVILDDDAVPVPVGHPGEIAIRGPQVMQGYWNRPQDTAQAMTPSGFFKTGDVGIMDHRGFIRIVDRKKDMILVSGFNVYPSEIESVIAAHPGVLECACVGVPDAQSGEAVKLYVVPRDAALTTDTLMEYCRREFTAYKKPKFVEFRAELPKSNVGKILRRQLRDEEAAPA